MSSLKSMAARFGPRPGTRIIASTDSGTCCLSSSSMASLPVVDQGGDLLGQVLADALDVGQLAAGIGDDFGHRLGQVADRAGRVAIGADAERIRPLEFQDVGD